MKIPNPEKTQLEKLKNKIQLLQQQKDDLAIVLQEKSQAVEALTETLEKNRHEHTKHLNEAREEFESLSKQNKELQFEVETYSLNMVQLMQENSALEIKATEASNQLQYKIAQCTKQIESLKQNELSVVLSELKLQHQILYDNLFGELLEVQNRLLHENDQILIDQRNQLRRRIVLCIDNMIAEAKSKINGAVQKTIEQIVDKKLDHVILVKNQLEKDISIETAMRDIEGQSLISLQEDLEALEKGVEFVTYRSRKNMKNTIDQEEFASLKKEIAEKQEEIVKHKTLVAMNSKRSNPLFGFPELQSAELKVLQQEKMNVFSDYYDVERWITPTSAIANRKHKFNSTLCGPKKAKVEKEIVFIKKFNKVEDWRHFKNQVDTLQRLNHQCVIAITRAVYDEHFYYV